MAARCLNDSRGEDSVKQTCEEEIVESIMAGRKMKESG